MDFSVVHDFTAGWLGGGIGLIVGHPLDTVKVRLQTLNYMGTYSCIAHTLKNEAFHGFYKGMLAPFMSVGFLHSVYFGVYGLTLKQYHVTDECSAPMSKIFLASAAGAFAQWIFSVPIEVVKVRLQMQREETKSRKLYAGPFDCAKKIYHSNGVVHGLYRGSIIMLFRDVIGFSCYLPVYEVLYSQMKGNEKGKNDIIATIMAGGVAGVTSWGSILPLDMVKSRIQGQNFQSPKYKNTLDCAVQIYREGGVSIFYRGFSVMAVRAFPVNAAIFVVYTKSLSVLNKLFPSKEVHYKSDFKDY